MSCFSFTAPQVSKEDEIAERLALTEEEKNEINVQQQLRTIINLNMIKMNKILIHYKIKIIIIVVVKILNK